MSLVATKAGGDFKLAPEGVHSAICFSIYDLGHHWSEFAGEGSFKHKCMIVFELHGDFDTKLDDGKPMAVNTRLTISLHEKANMRKLLEGWRGRKFTDAETEGFDLTALLGKPCQLQIMHAESKGKTYANIANILPAAKGEHLVQINPSKMYRIEEREKFPETMPEWIRKIVLQSQEMTGKSASGEESQEAPSHVPDLDSDVPF